jgi:hypothetical protein
MAGRSAIGAWLRAGRLAGAVRVGGIAAAVATLPVVAVVATQGGDVEHANIAVATVDAPTDTTGAGFPAETTGATAPADDDDPAHPGMPVVGDKPTSATTQPGAPTSSTTAATSATTRPGGATTTTTRPEGLVSTSTSRPGASTTTSRPGATTTASRPGATSTSTPTGPEPPPDTRPGPGPSTTIPSTTTTTTRPGSTTTSSTTTTTTTTTTTAPPTTTTTTTTTTTAPPAPTTPMPRLVGLPHADAYDQARSTQRRLGYFATTESADCAGNTDQGRFGVVFEQTPAPDTPLQQGTPITLRYYDTCTRVPDVVGTTLEEAQAILRRAGLQSSASTTCVAGVPDYAVLSQDPGPGGIVRQGTAVAIVANRGGCNSRD